MFMTENTILRHPNHELLDSLLAEAWYQGYTKELQLKAIVSIADSLMIIAKEMENR